MTSIENEPFLRYISKQKQEVLDIIAFPTIFSCIFFCAKWAIIHNFVHIKSKSSSFLNFTLLTYVLWYKYCSQVRGFKHAVKIISKTQLIKENKKLRRQKEGKCIQKRYT